MSTEKYSMNETTYSRVRDRLREDILRGIFEPGVRLPITELAQRYAVSQMPIREALQQLQGEGLITLLPQKGAHVKKIDEKFISNIYDIRGAIDALLIRKSIEVIKDKDIDHITEIQQRYEEAVSRQSLEEILELNDLLHATINGYADNPEALKIKERHWGLIGGFRKTFGYNPERYQETTKEHRNIIQAIKDRNPDLAAQLVNDHSMKAKKDLIESLNNKTAGRTR